MALPGLNTENQVLPTRNVVELAEANKPVIGIPEPSESYGAWSAGIDQAQGLGWRFVQMMGDLWDIESWEDRGELGAEENEALAAAYKRQAFQESEGMGDVSKWIHDTVKTQIPMMAPSIIAGGVAGVLAFWLGAPTAVASAATLAAAYVPNYVLNSGETYAKQIEAGGNISAKHAAVTGAFVALLDTIVPGKIATKFVKKGNFSSHVAKKLADGSKVGNQFKRAFRIGVWEAGTEGTQEAIMQMSRDWVNDESYGFTEQDKYEIIEGIAAGLLMGGFVGGGTPAGTQKARNQIEQENEVKRAILKKVGELQDQADAADTRQSRRSILNKIEKVKKAETLAEIESISPTPVEEEVLTAEELQEELSGIETRLVEAQAALAIENKKPRARAPNRVKLRLQEEIATITERSSEIRTKLEELAVSPTTVTDTTKVETPPDTTTPSTAATSTIITVDLTKSDLTPTEKSVLRTDDSGVGSMEVLPGESIKEAMIRVGIKKDPDFYINEAGIPTIVIRGLPRTPITEAPPGTPPADFPALLDEQIAAQETKVADAEAALDAEETPVVAGVPIPLTKSRFNRRRITYQANQRLKAAKAELQRLEAMKGSPEGVTWSDVARPTERVPTAIPSSVVGREAGPAPTAEEVTARIFERDLAVQEAAALREASERNRQEAEAKVRAAEEDAAAAIADEEAISRTEYAEVAAAEAEVESLLDAQAQAQTRAAADAPVITVEGLGSSTITNSDVSIATGHSQAIQQAKLKLWNLRNRQRKGQQTRDAAAETARIAKEEQRVILAQERDAQEAGVETERKRQEAEAKAQIEFESRETEKTVVEAEASAEETIAEFESRPLTITEMHNIRRGRANTIGSVDRVGAAAAKKAYLARTEIGVQAIAAKRAEETAAKREEDAAKKTEAAAAVTTTATEKPTTVKTKKPTAGEAAGPAVVAKTGEAQERVDVAPVISSPRDAVDAVIAGSLEPEAAIDELAIAMNATPEEAGVAFTDEMTTADAQAMVKAGEERGVVAAGTTEAVKTEATKTEKLKRAGEVAVAGVVTGVDTAPGGRKKQDIGKSKDETIRKTTYKSFRINRAGNKWTAKIANSPASITMDEVGEYHTQYKGVSNPTSFTSLEAAKISLIKEYGTPTEKAKLKGKGAEVLKTKVAKEPAPPKKQKYSSETINEKGVPVQFKYAPDENADLPFVKMVDGKPISRHKSRAAAISGLSSMTREKAAETLAIWEARLKAKQTKVSDLAKRGAARVEAAKGRAPVVAHKGRVGEPPKATLAGLPLPTLNDKKAINNPNVRIDADIESQLVKDVVGEEGNPITISYEKRKVGVAEGAKRKSFKESEVSGTRFWTFTPFFAKSKEEAQAISTSIYSNPDRFRIFLANETSVRFNPNSVSMGVISDDEAFQMQQSYQRRVDKLLQSETRTKRLTPQQQDDIVTWRAKIKDLNTNEGRNTKATIIPGTTIADFDESLTRWVDMLEDQGQDVSALKGALSLYTKKKVDEEVVEEDLVTIEGELVDKPVGIVTDAIARTDIADFFETAAVEVEMLTDEEYKRIWEIYNDNPMIELGDRQITAQEYIMEMSDESGFSDLVTEEWLQVSVPPKASLIQLDEEVVEENGIDALKAKVDEGEKLTVSHVGATDLEGMTDDSLRTMDMKDDLGKKLGEGGIGGFPSSKIEETQISLAEGNNFLEGAGHGADIVVLHRIPDEATAGAIRRTGKEGEPGAGPTVPEGHTLENWTDSIVDSGASLVYIWGSGSTGDFNGLDFQRVPGYEIVGEWNLEGGMGSGQYAVLNKVASIEEEVEQTAQEQTDEIIAADVARVEREVEEDAAVAADEVAAEDLGPDEGEMTDAEFDKIFGYTAVDEESALDEQYRKERADRRKQNIDEKTSAEFILINENPAELHSKLSASPSEGGYSAAEVKSLAANIKAVNSDFEYNPKANKADITASIMEWYTKPMEDAYVAEDLIENKENDDVVESRRLDRSTTFHSPRQAEQVIRSQFRGIFGKKAVSRFEEVGFINFIDSATAKEMGASETAQAFVSRGTGSIYFISNKIPSDMGAKEMRGLIFHEMGVHFGRDVFSGTEWDSVLLEVYRLSKSGDDIVNAGVARVMRRYNYKEFDSGPPVGRGPARTRIGIESRRKFWEEVLAHVVEVKQPVLDAPTRKGLVQKIRDAFKIFFTKISNAVGGTFTDTVTGDITEVPNVTLDDIVNLIGYSTWHSGIQALERHGDSKPLARLRNRKRSEFLEGSKMKELVFHGTPNDWSGPLIERTQLGLHVGTSIAAVNIAKARHFKNTPPIEALDDIQQELDGYIDIPPSGVVKAWKPGWEKQISNRDLEDISISWDPALQLKRSAIMEDNKWDVLFGDKKAAFTVFNKGSQILQGYINVQDPLVVNDLGNFSDASTWLTFANKKVREGHRRDEDRAMWIEISEVSAEQSRRRARAWKENNIREVWSIDEEFSKQLRALIKKNGYDSLEYINGAEDVGSSSWVLFDDNQFKSIYDLSYDSGTGIFSTKKIIKQSNSSEIVESRRVAREATKEVVYSRLGEAKANSFIKGIQRAIEPLMAIEGYDQLETERMLTKGSVGRWNNTGRIIFDILNEATPTEKRSIYKYFTTRGADPSNLPTRRVRFAEEKTILRGYRPGDTTVTKDESIRAKVVETKNLIASLGNDLVKTGLITQEQYNEWKNQYLPKVYMEHVMGGRDRIGLGGLRASSLTYTKHRKDHENFLNDVISGRIDDPAFLASRYVTMAGSDMAIIKYLDFIASDPGNNNWVLPGQIMSFKGMTGTSDYFKNLANDINHRANLGDKVSPERAKQMRELAMDMNSEADKASPNLSGVNIAKYRKVPDSPRYGAMRGLYVQKDIWNDINGLGIAGNPAWGNLLKWSGRTQTAFKYTKVPMNIPTQVRNIISNAILMNVSGTNLLRIPGAVSKAMHDVVSNGKYMQIARKYGLETTTFAATELGMIDRELAKVKSSADSFEGMWARSKVFFTDYLDVGGRAYQKTEVLFKVAKMIDLMENHGKSEAEAVKLANEALLDYGNVSQAIRLLRTMPLGSPFITFNAKALAQMARNIKQHPFASLKYAAVPYLLMEMFLSQNDDLDEDDWDSLMEFLPDYMETEFSTMVFPYKNEQGKWQAWDVSFFLPWGAHLHLAKNVAKAEFGEAIYGNMGMFGGPAQLPMAITLNEDPFTKQPIYNEFDPVWQRRQDLMMFLASYMMPPMLMPRNRAGAISRGGGPLIKTMMAADFIDGNVGADGLPRYTMPNALLSWGGVSIQQMGKADIARNLSFKERELEKIRNRMMQMISDPGISQEKREKLMNEYREHWLKTYEESRKWAEHLSSIERLFK